MFKTYTSKITVTKHGLAYESWLIKPHLNSYMEFCKLDLNHFEQKHDYVSVSKFRHVCDFRDKS